MFDCPWRLDYSNNRNNGCGPCSLAFKLENKLIYGESRTSIALSTSNLGELAT